MSEVEDYDDGPKGDEMEQDSDDAASVGSHSEQDIEEQKQHDSEVGSDVASEPASAPQSPSGSEGGQQSEDEVHISEQEEYEQSDKEDAHSDKNEEQSEKEDRESDADGERDDDEDQELAQDVESDKENNSDREDEQSSDRDEQQEDKEGEDDNRDKEDSDREESVPEIHIDSGDEYNDRESINKNSDDDDDRQSNSGSEVERDEGSDGEKGSDQDEANRPQMVDATSDAEENNDAGSEDERNSVISGRESPIEETPQSPTSPPDSDDEEKETKAESDDEEAPSGPVPLEDKMEISTEEMDKAENEAKSDSESDSDSDESKVGELIADIFGKSDDEEEEFEGFGEEDLAAVKQKKEKRKKAAKALSDSEEEVEVEEKENDEIQEAEELPLPTVQTENSETAPKKVIQPVSDDDSDDDGLRKMREDFVSDFDLMMQKKKEENQRKRKRKDVDIINDSDDLIAEIILQMRQAADEDRELNKQRKAATKKLKILPLVMSQLKKQDLKMAFLDQGVLNVMADWLSPLPDRSLPHFQIREGMIRRLGEFPVIDQSLLKCSGVGRALMYLYKHPKETKENRERCGKLITEWARPIFNLTTNFHSLTKEEREQRDFEHLPRKRKSRMESGEEEEQEKAGAKKDIEKVMSSEEKSLRPGEKGWIARARVPAPSMRDYVVRPKWNVEIEIGRGPAKKPLNRYEKHLRTIMEKKKLKKAQRAVTISIEGRKMAI